MPLILPGNVGSATAATGFNVANSCRFDGSSASMKITPGSNMNLLLQTWSGWIKRGGLGVLQSIFASDNTAGSHAELGFDTNDKLNFRNKSGNADKGTKITTRVFKDPSAWYHIVWAWDSANGTAANRLKIYVNGVQETAFDTSTNPDADEASQLGEADVATLIGTFVGEDSRFFNGYLAEVVLIDGAALAPTSFGEFDSDSGIWKPIDVSGLTFGTHGFYLDFEASGNLGNDANGGTDLGETNLAATDQSLDTCTNNFNTPNPIYGMQAIRIPIFAEGNLKITGDGDTQHHQTMGTFAVNKGKWYWEAKFTVSADIGKNKVGIMSVDLGSPQTAEIVDQSGSCVFVNEDGGDFRRDNATVDQNSGVFTQNQIIGVALNMDDGEISIYRDNSLIVDALDIGDADGTYVTPASVHYRDAGMEFNFGSAPYALTSSAADGDGFGAFEFAPPSGYFALCSKNLAEYG